MDPRGKVAVITGAGSGIGRATALALAGEGASIVVADFDDSSGAATVAMVEATGGKAAFIHTDVTVNSDVERMVAFATETFGGLDILMPTWHQHATPHFPIAPGSVRERCSLTSGVWPPASSRQYPSCESAAALS
jgi:enoyl-[acyl-carrier-protein] reductase (NADH)